ncbi:hypothetical protein PRUPE_6G124300 [Prunus persica]|uniref:Uncharacterized protein n=1 Tax=Prunus persica TaxID=3760 RepID=M5VYU0_PRUPE|nr:hypothetical protein PRUPE_6G124300 [Prunus persica]
MTVARLYMKHRINCIKYLIPRWRYFKNQQKFSLTWPKNNNKIQVILSNFPLQDGSKHSLSFQNPKSPLLPSLSQ